MKTDRCKGCIHERDMSPAKCDKCSRSYADQYRARQTSRTRALETIQNGIWWDYLSDDIPEDAKKDFLDAMDVAVAALLNKKDSLYICNGNYVMAAHIEEDDENNPRFSVVFEDMEGNVTQDIAIIQDDRASDTNGVHCLIFADHLDENYTDEFHIPEYAEK